MSLINFKDIDCMQSIKKENIVIEFCNSEIQIVPYLSIHDKYELIMATLHKSYENELYNPIKLNMYFELHLVFMYTNIIFSPEDKADIEGLYDILKNSGLIKIVKDNISKEEILDLESKFTQTLAMHEKYNSSIIGFLSNILKEATEKLQGGLSFLQNLNPEIIENVMKQYPQLQSFLQLEENNTNNN